MLDTGKKLSDDNTIGQDEIQQRLAQFVEHWKELKDLAAARYEPASFLAKLQRCFAKFFFLNRAFFWLSSFTLLLLIKNFLKIKKASANEQTAQNKSDMNVFPD